MDEPTEWPVPTWRAWSSRARRFMLKAPAAMQVTLFVAAACFPLYLGFAASTID